MKQFSIAIALILAMACSSLHAQTVNMQANIPFAFWVGKTVMPAGPYELRYTNGVLRGAARQRRPGNRNCVAHYGAWFEDTGETPRCNLAGMATLISWRRFGPPSCRGSAVCPRLRRKEKSSAVTARGIGLWWLSTANSLCGQPSKSMEWQRIIHPRLPLPFLFSSSHNSL